MNRKNVHNYHMDYKNGLKAISLGRTHITKKVTEPNLDPPPKLSLTQSQHTSMLERHGWLVMLMNPSLIEALYVQHQ